MDEPISPEVRALLRCPLTNQTLRFISSEELTKHNADLPEGGWITEDGSRVYPIEDGFPILVVDKSIEISLSDAD